MLLIDEEDWPLALVRWESPVGVMDIGLYRVRFEDWLRRDRAFAVLSIQPAQPTVESLHDVIHAPVWTGDLRRRAAQRCAAIACVVPDGRLADTLMEREAQRLQQLIGCTVAAFIDADEALRWARTRLREFRPPQLSSVLTSLPSGSHANRTWPN